MRIFPRSFFVLVASTVAGCGLLPPRTPTDRLEADVTYLAADHFEGRDTGSARNLEAAEWIADRMADLGLEPFDANAEGAARYFQSFETPLGKSLTDGNRFAAGEFSGKLGTDYVPSEFSRAGHAAGSVVAVRGRPDDAVDLAGKIALFFAESVTDADTTRAGLPAHVVDPNAAAHLKSLEWAYAHGAIGAIVVLPTDDVPAYTGRAPYEMSIPAVLVRAGDAAKLLAPSKLAPDAVKTQLAGNAVVALDGVLADIAIANKPNLVSVPNVIGRLPAKNPSARHVIIGAHFDHIGFGGDSRSRGKPGQIHNGADDNASGTAALLEIARQLAADPPANTSVVFIAFNGEELGLLGSLHYVKHAWVPLTDAWAMINLDMVGRSKRGADAKHASAWNYLAVGGAPSAEPLVRIVDEAHVAIGAPFELAKDMGVFNGSSDHINFYTSQVPVLFFFTGLHNEYHTDLDDAHLVDPVGAANAASLAAGVVRGIDRLETKPAYVAFEKQPTAPTSSSRAVDPKTGSAYGPWFGSIPEMAQRDDGVGIQGVQPGSPLETAGGKPGDVMTHFDGKPISTLKDFATLLRAKQVGDVVEVIVMRDGKPVTLSVKLTPKIPR